MRIRVAGPEDREWIFRTRHEVFARELGQHQVNGQGMLSDAMDERNVYLVAEVDGEHAGFVSVTPPWAGRYALEKHLGQGGLDQLAGGEELFEVRLLTVAERFRGSLVAGVLLHAALRWVVAHGGRRVAAMGRAELMEMYRGIGLAGTGRVIRSGAVEFELMTGDTAEMARVSLERYGRILRTVAKRVVWELDTPFLPDEEACYHGGASIGAIGERVDALDGRHAAVPADVLDAWYAPAPGVEKSLMEDPAWLARTSPPADAAGLLAEVCERRGLPAESVALGAGSSDLIFRAMRGWLRPDSRVLLVDPMYGEYAHVVEQVAGCRAERFRLRRDEDWRIDPGRLSRALAEGRYDLAVIVNPNNPTGQVLDTAVLRAVLDGAPRETRFWIDEAYLEYTGQPSLEGYAALSPNVVVAKTLSKMYALSGLRAGYLAGPPALVREIRRWTPPWAVSLPAQVAAVQALRETEYYAARWAETARLRRDLAAALRELPGAPRVLSGYANSVLLTLPEGAPTATRVVRACRGSGVFVRDLTGMSPSFEGRTLRISVRGAEENARVVAALRGALA
ncbi:histidinol-phosphate aminotransferase family protein [Actinomadura macrotermitis]|uniref:Histidinol-phosphate aminotransferase n=1 Tax=Actinomadura macrotermitis TaxID=2585200 RepID=A0A7K0C636_9ACTN|nr:histidinol-phosphate transaminase [Actinomadura macrotermitis]MQY08919.1 Histidinol-phosphate aminotransferase [Actinomadura macrotermitis]